MRLDGKYMRLSPVFVADISEERLKLAKKFALILR